MPSRSEDAGGVGADRPDEELAGGNVGRVVRRGDRVHRETGPWTPAVHRLLRHLEGVPGVPRVYGFDEAGREVLDHLPGQIVDVDTDELTDAQLVSLVSWTRRLHERTATFDGPGPWRLIPPPGADLVGHNDLAPYNVCFDSDDLVGVFDWDVAGPTTALLELGLIAWTCVPLFRVPAVPDPDAWSAARLRLIADTYGSLEAAEVLAATVARIEHMIVAIDDAVARGDAGMARLTERSGEPACTQRALAALSGRVPAIDRYL